jgi:HPt (histidine-containing phosphotransfer) domain-containing protein
MEPITKPELSAALNLLWAKFLPDITERVSILENAAAALASNTLTADQIAAAHAAAHKLAGILGTFNLTRGTVLARELELMYCADGGPDPDSRRQLASVAAELRVIVASRK